MGYKETNVLFDALSTPPVKPVSLGKRQTQKKKVHFASPVVTQVVIIPPRPTLSTSNTTSKVTPQIHPHYSWILMALSHPVTKLAASILIIAGLGVLSATTLGAAPFVLGLTIGLVSLTSGAGLFSASHMNPVSLEAGPALCLGTTKTP
jgi:hypothetical protein